MLTPAPFLSRAKVLSFQEDDGTATDETVYTFAGKAIGAADASRRVIVAVHGMGNGRVISGVTVGGVAATINAQAQSGGASCGIVTALVPSGTTADVVVTFAGVELGCGIGVWAAYGLGANAAYDSGTSTGADPATDTLATLPGGFCVAATSVNGNVTVTWSNVDERYDGSVGENRCVSGADEVTTGANIAPSAAYSDAGTTNRAAAFATW